MYIHIQHHSKLTEDANWNKQKRCHCQNKYFSGTSYTVRHVKIFKIISNEMPDLLLILCR